MSTEANKELVRRYIQAIDDNHSSDWSVLDEYIAEASGAQTRSSRRGFVFVEQAAEEVAPPDV
jgi:collagenase-like PrtC family protease